MLVWGVFEFTHQLAAVAARGVVIRRLGAQRTTTQGDCWLCHKRTPPPAAASLPPPRDALVSERERLFEQLQGVPFLQPYPSHANFILCKVTQVGHVRGHQGAARAAATERCREGRAPAGADALAAVL